MREESEREIAESTFEERVGRSSGDFGGGAGGRSCFGSVCGTEGKASKIRLSKLGLRIEVDVDEPEMTESGLELSSMVGSFFGSREGEGDMCSLADSTSDSRE